MRSRDTATQDAINDRRAVAPRNFVLVGPVVPIGGGSPVVFGFTDFGEDITTNIVDGRTGETVSHVFFGDNAPIVSIDTMPLRVGVEVDTVQVTLNHLHPAVAAMVRGHNCRNAPAQILRGWLSPESMLLVASPTDRRLGFVNGTPLDTPAAGEQGSATLRVVSQSRELTRVNPVKSSREFYARRSNDQWGRYTGVTGDWPIWWGEMRSKT